MTQAIQSGYSSLSLLFSLNWDRILYVTAICMSLLFGAFLGTIFS
ncbi:hypothetical protein [Pseudooceanicola pacificus]|nr:hypothetical protein [Pseudooceanicola pacificus]